MTPPANCYNIIISMTNYQLTFLVSLKLEAEQAVQYQDQIITQLKELGAEIQATSEMKEQMLAYPIRGERKVWLNNLVFSLDPEKISSVEEFLNHEKHILRHMIFRRPAESKEGSRPRRRRPEPVAEPAAEKPEEVVDSKGLDQKINEILDW